MIFLKQSVSLKKVTFGLAEVGIGSTTGFVRKCLWSGNPSHQMYLNKIHLSRRLKSFSFNF